MKRLRRAVATVVVALTLMAAYPSGSDANQPANWEGVFPHPAQCYKHEAGVNSEHGNYASAGKGFVLNPFNQGWPGDHWEALIIKAGQTNAVYVHPNAGTLYLDGNNPHKTISHVIVCKGTTPEVTPSSSPSVTPTPTPTPSPTPTPTPTATPSPSPSPTSTPTATSTPTPSPTPTPTFTNSTPPSETPSPTPSASTSVPPTSTPSSPPTTPKPTLPPTDTLPTATHQGGPPGIVIALMVMTFIKFAALGYLITRDRD